MSIGYADQSDACDLTERAAFSIGSVKVRKYSNYSVQLRFALCGRDGRIVIIRQSINSFLFPHSITLETHVHNKYWPSAEKGTRSKTGNR